MVKIRGIKVDVKTKKKEIVEEEIPDHEYQKRLKEAERIRKEEEKRMLIEQKKRELLERQAIHELIKEGKLKPQDVNLNP